MTRATTHHKYMHTLLKFAKLTIVKVNQLLLAKYTVIRLHLLELWMHACMILAFYSEDACICTCFP